MRKQSRTQERVALARDVLKQIKVGQLVVVNGTYLGGRLHDAARELKAQSEYVGEGLYGCARYVYPNEKSDMRDLMKKGALKGISCRVCAKGALFIAHILRNDKVTLKEFTSVSLSHPAEGKNAIPAFTPRQLDEIEALFENFSGDFDERQSEKMQIAAARLSKLSKGSPKKKLALIMKLIIKNKGRKVVL